ncbi:MAG: prepilin-type N-terminal cleavage/methylation domain-containing protein [Candidatus Theseobacter exili]|nr:prepilin-type N-terminal cleavage/methylation domain-containing protein [Candidatus Theseobacter exili]
MIKEKIIEKQGITLVELMVSLGISAVILASSSTVFFSVAKSARVLEDKNRILEMACNTAEIFLSDLSSAGNIKSESIEKNIPFSGSENRVSFFAAGVTSPLISETSKYRKVEYFLSEYRGRKPFFEK